jgi:hypothetical protein
MKDYIKYRTSSYYFVSKVKASHFLIHVFIKKSGFFRLFQQGKVNLKLVLREVDRQGKLNFRCIINN